MTIAACFAAGAMLVSGLAAQSATKVKWDVKLIDQRGPFRTADVTRPTGKEAMTQILGGPGNGSEAGYLLYTKMAAGAHGPALFTLAVDDLYLVLSGKMTVQIGTDKFVAGPNSGVYIPAGIPHATWNAESEPEANIEVITPAPSLDLLSMLTPATPRKVDNAAQYVREAPPLPATLKPGLNGQQLFSLRGTSTPN